MPNQTMAILLDIEKVHEADAISIEKDLLDPALESLPIQPILVSLSFLLLLMHDPSPKISTSAVNRASNPTAQ